MFQTCSTLTTLADAKRTTMPNTYCSVHSVEILLMMDRGHVRNMQSTLSNKFEKQCILLAVIIRTYVNISSKPITIQRNFIKYSYCYMFRPCGVIVIITRPTFGTFYKQYTYRIMALRPHVLRIQIHS